MRVVLKKLIVLGILLMSSEQAAIAAEGKNGREGLSSSLGIMILTNSTQQGGQGTQGSTVLTETNINWHFGYWALGTFIQFDKQGDSETDFATGPRVEGTFDPFYFEFGYSVIMNRSFSDRAISKQTGSGYMLGVGTRFNIASSKWFILSTYKYRTQIINDQDGEELDEPITQIDGYPLFGIGVDF